MTNAILRLQESGNLHHLKEKGKTSTYQLIELLLCTNTYRTEVEVDHNLACSLVVKHGKAGC